MTAPTPGQARIFLCILGAPVLVLLVLTLAAYWRLDWRARKEARALAAQLGGQPARARSARQRGLDWTGREVRLVPLTAVP